MYVHRPSYFLGIWYCIENILAYHLRNKSTGELNPYGYQVNDALNVALGDMGEEGSLNKESMGQLYNFLRKNPDLMRGV